MYHSQTDLNKTTTKRTNTKKYISQQERFQEKEWNANAVNLSQIYMLKM